VDLAKRFRQEVRVDFGDPHGHKAFAEPLDLFELPSAPSRADRAGRNKPNDDIGRNDELAQDLLPFFAER
jgi:hypothetical protein